MKLIKNHGSYKTHRQATQPAPAPPLTSNKPAFTKDHSLPTNKPDTVSIMLKDVSIAVAAAVKSQDHQVYKLIFCNMKK